MTIILLLFTKGDNTASSNYVIPAKQRCIYAKNDVPYMYSDGSDKIPVAIDNNNGETKITLTSDKELYIKKTVPIYQAVIFTLTAS